ncbi:hypothetical protein DEU56DRAFT_790297 [Suillus clintonianus]|uniref:uncharacterized protein n=1 Tax=Suillus clintonianus TaxID=1904413 RepID=UPI001B864FE2|nr:uncharacterized protein DEU56DRAFT_790297 [Suillus clintonianus]KAG2144566.1 hypothetical protein DEU56DRAFT_790297 [Suillus clintonianus]
MVVTRRTPVVPAPPVSRTPSSQGQPRSARATVIQDASAVPRVSSPLASGDARTAAIITGASNNFKQYNDKDEHKTSKKKDKPKKSGKKKKRKSTIQSLLDFLTKLLLFAFTIYVFSVCPREAHLQSPVCRGLSEYKRIVLDPYVIPPLQAALAHPSVAPYLNRIAEVSSPIILRTQGEWTGRVLPQWEKHVVPVWSNRVVPAFTAYVVPQWEKRVVPQWQKHVVPQYDKHIVPQLSKLEPYVARAESYVEQAGTTYTTRIAPHVRTATYNLQRWQQKAQPYTILAIQKTQDTYYAAKPHAVPLAKRIVAEVQHALLFLREQRRIFVDPHVAKLWEKVKELSRGSPATSTSTDVPSDTTAFPSPEPVISETLEPESTYAPIAPTSDDQPAAETDSPCHTATETSSVGTLLNKDATTAAETEVPIPFDAVPITYLSSQPASASSSHSPSNSVPTPVQTPESASSVLSESASAAPSIVSAAVDDSNSPIAYATLTGSAASSSAPAHISDDDEIDISAFYAELGLDEPLTASQSHEQVPLNPPESEEERAERLRLKAEETARKRADIEVRHSKWETDLRSQMETGSSTLKGKLEAIRSVAAVELAEAPEIRDAIESLVADAEKYIKGAEVYLRNLKAESRKNDEKMPLWERVVEKVGVKFSERLGVVEAVVNTWYGVILDQELREVYAVAAEVREVAEKAQVDLGLDYAWLDEVTYSDWQRYHSLIDASEKFVQEANSIQNGTHENLSVDNPIIPIIEDLESEVQDVVIGFETRLRRIKRDGERAFNSIQKDEEKETATDPEQPEVSILPIPEGGASGHAYVPPVVIGRSKEEVLEALGKVEPLEESSGYNTPEDADAGEVVSSLVREAEEEHSESAAIPHTEL